MRFVMRDASGKYLSGFGRDDDGYDVAKYTKNVNDALVLTLQFTNGVFITSPSIPAIRSTSLHPVALSLCVVEESHDRVTPST